MSHEQSHAPTPLSSHPAGHRQAPPGPGQDGASQRPGAGRGACAPAALPLLMEMKAALQAVVQSGGAAELAGLAIQNPRLYEVAVQEGKERRYGWLGWLEGA